MDLLQLENLSLVQQLKEAKSRIVELEEQLAFVQQHLNELATENTRLRDWKIGYGRRKVQRKALRQV